MNMGRSRRGVLQGASPLPRKTIKRVKMTSPQP